MSELTFRERMYTKNYKTNGLVVETDVKLLGRRILCQQYLSTKVYEITQPRRV